MKGVLQLRRAHRSPAAAAPNSLARFLGTATVVPTSPPLLRLAAARRRRPSRREARRQGVPGRGAARLAPGTRGVARRGGAPWPPPVHLGPSSRPAGWRFAGTRSVVAELVVADLLPAALSPSVPTDEAAHALPAGRSRREGAPDLCCPPLPLPPPRTSATPSTAVEQGRCRGLHRHPVVVRARSGARHRRMLRRADLARGRRRRADLAREGGRRCDCPSSIAGARGRAAKEQRTGEAEE
jgi:hypothetical protein